MTFNPEQAAAYLAGMIDGEGNLGEYGRRPGANRHIRITNCDYGLIEACAHCCNVLGVTYRIREKTRTNPKPNWSQAWELIISGKENIRTVAALVPLQAPKKSRALQELAASFHDPVTTKEELERMYNEEHMSYKQIADRLGIGSLATVRRLFLTYGIQPRTLESAALIKWQSRNRIPRPSKEDLEGLYNEQEMSYADIARHYNAPISTVMNWIHIHGIQPRPAGHTRKHRKE